jgi:hypothetical protein
MSVMDEIPARVPVALSSSLTLAVAFEAFLLLVTQDKPVMAVTPWQDDPFHAWISLAVVALPMLLAVVAIRWVGGAWLPWGTSSPRARRRDLAKAGLVLTTFGAGTALVCWLSVLLRQHRESWDERTWWLLLALAVMTAAVPVVAWLGIAAVGALPRERDSDWVGDVLPADLAAWVRRHDVAVFAGASGVAAAGVIGALAFGERWTDPLLIGWALLVEVTCYYAFCVVTNALLGFVDRPDRSDRQRRTERALVIGTLVLQAAVAMHGQLEPRFGIGSVDGVGRLVQVTVAPGVLAFAAAMVLLPFRRGVPARPAR